MGKIDDYINAKLSAFKQSVGNFTQQYPTPASYIVPKAGNALANVVQGTVSPIPVRPLQQPVQAARNIAAETIRKVSNEIPSIGTSMVRLSPPGQLYKQYQGQVNPTLRPKIQEQRVGDAYKSLQGIGLMTGGVAAPIISGAIGMGMNAVGNALSGKPLSANYDKAFANGVMDTAAFTPISKIASAGINIAGQYSKPVAAIASYINGLDRPLMKVGGMHPIPLNTQLFQRSLGAGIKGFTEGAITGSIRPLEEGETRHEAIFKDSISYAAMGAATKLAGDSYAISKDNVKRIAKNIGMGFKEYWDFLRGKGWVQRPDGSLVRKGAMYSSIRTGAELVDIKPSPGNTEAQKGIAKAKLKNLMTYPNELATRGYTQDQIKRISAPRAAEIIKNNVTPEQYFGVTGPGVLPWETPEYLAAQAKRDSRIKTLRPINPRAEQLTNEEAMFKKEMAQVAAEQPKAYRDALALAIGKHEAARTRATQAAAEFTAIPKDLAWDVIRAREGATKVDPQAKVYADKLKEVYDKAFKEAKDAGVDMNYVEGYVTHIWDRPQSQVKQMYQSFKQKFNYASERVLPTYEEGIRMGLKPKFENPAQILNEYVTRLEKVKANIELFKELKNRNLIVNGARVKGDANFVPITAIGFPRSEVQIGGGKTVISNWYAPRALAEQINKIANPQDANPILRAASNLSGKFQDITMSGGLPGTPINSWSIAQTTKEILSGRVKSPVQALFRSVSEKASNDYFQKNAGQIIKMQERNIPVSTSFNVKDLIGENKTLKDKLKGAWDMAVNDPTFKRFMPQLQIQFFNDIESQALKRGMDEKTAADVAASAVKNFYGVVGSDTTALRDKNVQALVSALFFAPRYRESMLNFWANTGKALTNPLALENRQNAQFAVGAFLTLLSMNEMNKATTGHNMWENPPGKEDKLLVKTPQGWMGLPFLSSIATIPRAMYRQGAMLAKGDVSGTFRDAMKTYPSVMFRPIADVLANEDYYGKPITKDTMTSGEKFKAMGQYLGSQYTGHPYIKELSDVRNWDDPLYQRISRAVEAPIRYYNDVNGRDALASGYYYQVRDQVLKGMNAAEKAAWERIHPTKEDGFAADKGILSSQEKAMLYLNNPKVQLREMQLAKALKDKLGQEYDPVWDLPLEKRNQVFAARTSLPGEKNSVKTEISKQDWYREFQKKESAFFDSLGLESTSGAPQASEYVQQQMDLKNWADPQVRTYLDALTAYNNKKREALGLTPVGSYAGGARQKKVAFKKVKVARSPKIRKLAFKTRLPKVKKVTLKAYKVKKPAKLKALV